MNWRIGCRDGIRFAAVFNETHTLLILTQEHTRIAIPDGLKGSMTHYLTVPAEIPEMQVVHTVHLRLVSARTENQTESSHVAISHAVPAELTIKHTRKWGTLASSRNANKPLDFCYEIQASPELWLVGGQRKAQFSARVSDSTPTSFIVANVCCRKMSP